MQVSIYFGMSSGKVDSGMLQSVFGEIEDKEQVVIQSLRTSGIRKATETSIIDQLLDIRRGRRRIFSDLMVVCDKQRSSISELEKQIEILRNDQLQRERRYHASIEEYQRKTGHEIEVATLSLKKSPN